MPSDTLNSRRIGLKICGATDPNAKVARGPSHDGPPSYPWSAYREGLLTERQIAVNEKQSEQLPGR